MQFAKTGEIVRKVKSNLLETPNGRHIKSLRCGLVQPAAIVFKLIK